MRKGLVLTWNWWAVHIGHLARIIALLLGTKCPKGIFPAQSCSHLLGCDLRNEDHLFCPLLFNLEWVFWWRKQSKLALFTSVLRGGKKLVTLQKMEFYVYYHLLKETRDRWSGTKWWWRRQPWETSDVETLRKEETGDPVTLHPGVGQKNFRW